MFQSTPENRQGMSLSPRVDVASLGCRQQHDVVEPDRVAAAAHRDDWPLSAVAGVPLDAFDGGARCVAGCDGVLQVVF